MQKSRSATCVLVSALLLSIVPMKCAFRRLKQLSFFSFVGATPSSQNC